MRQFALILILLANILSTCYANTEDYYDMLERTNTIHMSRFEKMCIRANKRHGSEFYRDSQYISNKEYYDCSYYLKTNCDDIRFARCWQCRNEQYNVQITTEPMSY